MTWIKLDDNILDDPKILRAGEDAAFLYIAGLCYASRNLTDGIIPTPVIGRLTGHRHPEKLARALTDAGLWIKHDDHYETCAYLTHQRSKADVEHVREQARARARRSRDVRATSKRTTSENTPNSPRSPREVQREVRANPPRSQREVREPETDTETEPDGIQGGSLTRSRIAPGYKPPPHIVQQLADEGWTARLQAEEFPKFVDHARANGRMVTDWNAAYSLWVRRAKPDQVPRSARFVCANCGADEAQCECGYDAEFHLETGGLG